jgi:hypothetical protein
MSDAAATPEDLAEICLGLPEVEWGTSWGDVPTYLVKQNPKPRGFVLYRAPRHDAVDPTSGEQYDDLIVIRTANPADKAALVADERTPFFTIDHFNNYNAVLVQEARLGELTRAELAEVITDAWLAVAPKRLAKQFLAEVSTSLDNP